MGRVFLQRLFHIIPLLLGISFIAFAVMHLAPGDYLTTLSQDPGISPDALSQMRRDYGLDKPWGVQYLLWLWNALRLQFGFSLAYHVPVTTLLGQRLWNTFLLSFCSMVFAWCLAIPLGLLAAVRRNSLLDRGISLLAFAGISFPGFFLALLLMILAYRSTWFPVGGMHSPIDDFLTPMYRVLDVAHHLALPVLVLGSAGLAGIMRQMRGSVLDILRENFITAARARGLPESTVILKHALRNAINPLITLFGYSLAGLLSGAALVENVMGWPGLGRLILEAVQKRDLYLVMGSFVMGAILLLIGNLIADLLLAAADPRIRMGK